MRRAAANFLKERIVVAIDLSPQEKTKFRWTGSRADRIVTGIAAIIGWELAGWIIRHVSIVFH